MPLLEIENLSISVSQDGVETPLVRDVSYPIEPGETLALVGESGSGKSVSSLAVMGLLAKALRVTSGRIAFEGQDLLALDGEAMRAVRGRDISMVFQEPMTSLNPVRSIGAQIIGSWNTMEMSRPRTARIASPSSARRSWPSKAIRP
nr:ATP-binding cassette domain-containing protein [Paracoccaceae bacterium]